MIKKETEENDADEDGNENASGEEDSPILYLFRTHGIHGAHGRQGGNDIVGEGFQGLLGFQVSRLCGRDPSTPRGDGGIWPRSCSLALRREQEEGCVAPLHAGDVLETPRDRVKAGGVVPCPGLALALAALTGQSPLFKIRSPPGHHGPDLTDTCAIYLCCSVATKIPYVEN